MFDYSIQIQPEDTKFKLIMTVDREIVLEKLYNNQLIYGLYFLLLLDYLIEDLVILL